MAMSAEKITEYLNGNWISANSGGRAYCPICQQPDTSNPALSIQNGDHGGYYLYCHKSKCCPSDVMFWLNERAPQAALSNPVPPARRPTQDRLEQAWKIWDATQPIGGTLGEVYLRNRGIREPLPECLRFSPLLWHGPTKQLAPAIVARAEPLGSVHRIFLNGQAQKLTNDHKCKLSLGPVRGGAVRLRSGNYGLIVAEGIETALSVPEVYTHLAFNFSLWATLGTSGMRTLELPEAQEYRNKLVIAADGGGPGTEAALVLARNGAALGWDVEFLQSTDEEDFNDLLIRKRANAN